MEILVGILQWTIAILSVVGTVALVTWITVMVFKKDRKDDSAGNRY